MIQTANTLERTGPQDNINRASRRLFGFFGNFSQFGTETDEYIHKINGRRVSWYRKARYMRLDPTINFLRLMFAGRMFATEFSVEHDEDVPDEIVEYVRTQIKRHWKEVVKCATFGCLDFGWQGFEHVYRLEDGYWVIDKVKPLIQDITNIYEGQENGEFLGFSQGDGSLRVEDGGISLFNFLREGTYHYGWAPLKSLERPFDRQQTLYTQIERYDSRLAASHWVIYYPQGVTPIDPTKPSNMTTGENLIDNFEMAQKIMQVLLSTGAIVIPSSLDESITRLNEIGGNAKGPWRIELLSNGDNSGTAPYSERLKYYDNQYARGLGFPERAVFEGQHGTKSESESQSQGANVIADVFLNDLCRGANDYFVPDLIRTNWGSKYARSVRVCPNPVTKSDKERYWAIYERILEDPELRFIEHEKWDMDALREKMGIPVDEDVKEGEGERDPDDNVPFELGESGNPN